MFVRKRGEEEPQRWYRLADSHGVSTALNEVSDNRPLLPASGPAVSTPLRQYILMPSGDVRASWMGRTSAGTDVSVVARGGTTGDVVGSGIGSSLGARSVGGADGSHGANNAGGTGSGGTAYFRNAPHLQRHQHLVTPWASFSSGDTVLRPPAAGTPSMQSLPNHAAQQGQQQSFHQGEVESGQYWQQQRQQHQRPPHLSMPSWAGASGVHPMPVMDTTAGNDSASRATYTMHVAPAPSLPSAPVPAAVTAQQTTGLMVLHAAGENGGPPHLSRAPRHLASHLGSRAVGGPAASPHGGGLTPAAAMAAIAALDFGSATIIDERGGAIARPHPTGAGPAPPLVQPPKPVQNYFSWGHDPYHSHQQVQGLWPYHYQQGPMAAGPMAAVQMASGEYPAGGNNGSNISAACGGPIPLDTVGFTAIQQWLLLVPDHSKVALAKAWRMSLRRRAAAAAGLLTDGGGVRPLREERRYWRRWPTVVRQHSTAASVAGAEPVAAAMEPSWSTRDGVLQPAAAGASVDGPGVSAYHYQRVGDNLTPELVLKYTNQLYGEDWDTHQQPAEQQATTPFTKKLMGGRPPRHVIQTFPSAASKSRGVALSSTAAGGNGSSATMCGNGTRRLHEMYNQLLGQAVPSQMTPAVAGSSLQQQPGSTAIVQDPRAPPLACLPVMPDLEEYVTLQQAAGAVDPPPTPLHVVQQYIPKAAVWQAAWAAQRAAERDIMMDTVAHETLVYTSGQQHTERRIAQTADGNTTVDASSGATGGQVQSGRVPPQTPRWRDRQHMESALTPVFLVDLDSIKVAISFIHGHGRTDVQTQTERRGANLGWAADADEGSSQHTSAVGSGSDISAESSTLRTTDGDVVTASAASSSAGDDELQAHTGPSRLQRLLRSMNPFHWWQPKDGAQSRQSGGRGGVQSPDKVQPVTASSEDGYSSDAGSSDEDQQENDSISEVDEEASKIGEGGPTAVESSAGDSGESGDANPAATLGTITKANKVKREKEAAKMTKASTAHHQHGVSATRNPQSSRKDKKWASVQSTATKHNKTPHKVKKTPTSRKPSLKQNTHGALSATASGGADGGGDARSSNLLAGQEDVVSANKEDGLGDHHKSVGMNRKSKASKTSKTDKQLAKAHHEAKQPDGSVTATTTSTPRHKLERGKGSSHVVLIKPNRRGSSAGRRKDTDDDRSMPSGTAAGGNSHDNAEPDRSPIGLDEVEDAASMVENGAHGSHQQTQGAMVESKKHAKSHHKQHGKNFLAKLKIWKRGGGGSKHSAAGAERAGAGHSLLLETDESDSEKLQQQTQGVAPGEAVAADESDDDTAPPTLASSTAAKHKQQAIKQQQKRDGKVKAARKIDNKKPQETTDLAKDNTMDASGAKRPADGSDGVSMTQEAAIPAAGGDIGDGGTGAAVDRDATLPGKGKTGGDWLFKFRKGLGLLPPNQQRMSGTISTPMATMTSSRQQGKKLGSMQKQQDLLTVSATSADGEAATITGAGSSGPGGVGAADGMASVTGGHNASIQQTAIPDVTKDTVSIEGSGSKSGLQQDGALSSTSTSAIAKAGNQSKQPKQSFGNRLAKMFFGSYPTPAPAAEPPVEAASADSVREIGLPQAAGPRTDKSDASSKGKADTDNTAAGAGALAKAGTSPISSQEFGRAGIKAAAGTKSPRGSGEAPGQDASNHEIEALESSVKQEESPKADSTISKTKGRGGTGSHKKSGGNKLAKKSSSPAASTPALPPPQGPKAKLMRNLLKLSDVVNAQRAAANTPALPQGSIPAAGEGSATMGALGPLSAKSPAADAMRPSSQQGLSEDGGSSDGGAQGVEQLATDTLAPRKGKPSSALDRLRNNLATSRARKSKKEDVQSQAAAAATIADGDVEELLQEGIPPASQPVMWGTQRAAAQEVLQHTARIDTASQHGGSGGKGTMMERMMASLRRPKHKTEVQEMVTFKDVPEPKGLGTSSTTTAPLSGAQRDADGLLPSAGAGAGVVASPSMPNYKGGAGGPTTPPQKPLTTATVPSSPAGQQSRFNSTGRSDLSATTSRRQAHGENLMHSIRSQRLGGSGAELAEQQDRKSPDPNDVATASPAGGWAVQSAKSLQSTIGLPAAGGSTPGSPLMQSMLRSPLSKTATMVRGQDVAPSPAGSSLLASLQEQVEEGGDGDSEGGGGGRRPTSAAAMASQLAELGLPPSKW